MSLRSTVPVRRHLRGRRLVRNTSVWQDLRQVLCVPQLWGSNLFFIISRQLHTFTLARPMWRLGRILPEENYFARHFFFLCPRNDTARRSNLINVYSAVTAQSAHKKIAPRSPLLGHTQYTLPVTPLLSLSLYIYSLKMPPQRISVSHVPVYLPRLFFLNQNFGRQ